MQPNKLPSSFRDPCGYIFSKNNQIFRVINKNYKAEYTHLMQSGLYKELISKGLLIKHQEVFFDNIVYKIIKPQLIQYISYPYEWSFNQLKDVALAALKIQKTALKFSMSLKDCSAYNFQFINLKPVLIDTLSFEKYKLGSPWIAYKQFCQHFLAPLVLAYYKDIRLNNLLKHYLDGIPLDLASKLLPISTYFKLPLLINIHLHAKSQRYYSQKKQLVQIKKLSIRKMAKNSLLALIDNLAVAINGLSWKEDYSFWDNYYNDNSYSKKSFDNKISIFKKYLSLCSSSKNLLDLGSNSGIFSFIASKSGLDTVALDYDYSCIDRIYLIAKEKKYHNILPVINDLSNPSGNLGWNFQERSSLKDRFASDIALALALMHHLIIGNNVPLNDCVSFINDLTRKYLIIEYVPIHDFQVQEMIKFRRNYHTYTESDFVQAFTKKFKIIKKLNISQQSDRVMYLMKKIDEKNKH